MKPRFFAFLIFIFIFMFLLTTVTLPLKTAALENKQYVWVLTDTVEFLKANEVDSFNVTYKDTYKLAVFGSEGFYTYKLNYLGVSDTTTDDGRIIKEGDYAVISALFGDIPVFLDGGMNVELSIKMGVKEDTTSDKSSDFLSVEAKPFFDKVGAQPDIPSSEAVYFTDKEVKTTKLSVGTSLGSKKTIDTTVYASAPYGEREGDKISVCFSLRGPVDIGIKYIYEWKLKDLIGTQDKNTTEVQDITLSSVSGNVNIITSSSGSSQPGKDKMVIKKGQMIETLFGSSCEALLSNGSVINLSENTKLLISEQNIDYTKIRLLSGKIWANFLVPTDGEMVKVEMEHAQFWASGCIFAAEESTGNSSVWNFSNTIFFTASYSGETIQLLSGQNVSFDDLGNADTGNFQISKEAENRGIPIELIITYSGFAWVDKFIYGVIAVLSISLITTATFYYIRKRKRLKRISEQEPAENQCQYCGKDISYDLFCPKCGAAVKKRKEDPKSNE